MDQPFETRISKTSDCRMASNRILTVLGSSLCKSSFHKQKLKLKIQVKVRRMWLTIPGFAAVSAVAAVVEVGQTLSSLRQLLRDRLHAAVAVADAASNLHSAANLPKLLICPTKNISNRPMLHYRLLAIYFKVPVSISLKYKKRKCDNHQLFK